MTISNPSELDDDANSTLRFQGYHLEPVYLSISDQQRAEVIAMWHAARAHTDPSIALQRSTEVVLLVRHEASGELAGVSSVALKPRPSDNRLLYHFRMFLRPEHRRPYLMREVTNGTRDFLKDFTHPSGPAVGMLIVTENRKLMRPGIRAYLSRHGCVFRGRLSSGQDVWLAPF